MSTMIESVQARQRGAFAFEEHYDNLCALQNSCPIPAVKAHLPSQVLDLNADRIRANDWAPILHTLRINKTLEFIGMRSFFQQPVDDGKQDKKQPQQWRRKTPAIRSKEISYRLCKALREFITNTSSIVCLELQGLPLRERDMQILSKGIAKNHSLRHLSVEFCTIGDDGVEILCKGIKNSSSITSLNFSGCGLTFQGADMLAKIIKHQSARRHNEAWRDSLRYRRPDLDGMMGIRRITVNKNPLMGDQGALAFAEALKDDLWLKALDMQQCGISDTGAKALLQVLKFNTTIVVLDLRLNPLIDREIQQSVMEQVLINSDGQDTEYKWIRAEDQHDSQRNRSPRRRRTKTSGSYRGRANVKIIPSSGRKRSKSAGAVAYGKAFEIPEVTRPGPGFVPWRTAMRAMSYRGYPNPASGWEKNDGLSPMDSPAVIINKASQSDDEDCEQSYMRAHGITDESLDESIDFKDAKEVKIALTQMKRGLVEERAARNHADKRMLELTVENTRLRQELAMMRQAGGGPSLLEDDRVLDSIEASFKKFHSFLDLLRDAGLGQLITIAGLDQAPMSVPTASRKSPYRTAFPVTTVSGIPKHNIHVREPQFLDDDLLDGEDRPNQSLYGIPEASPPSRDQDHNIEDAILTGAVQPHLIPDNYTRSQILDPTLQKLNEEDEYAFKPSSADELYQKLRRQAEAALERSRTYYDMEPQAVVTSTPHKSKSPVSIPDTPERKDGALSGEESLKVSAHSDQKRVSPKPAERRKQKSPVEPVSPEVYEVPESEGISEAYSDTFERSERHELIKSMDDITESAPSPPAVVPESEDEDF